MKVLALAVVFSIFNAVQAVICGRTCRFRLCKTDTDELAPVGRSLIMRPPNVAVRSPTICLPGVRMGAVLRTGEALVEKVGKKRTPISQFSPSVLTTPFAARFFRTARVPSVVIGKSVSAIVKGKSRGNQHALLDDLCIRLPIVEYERLDREGKVVGKVRTEGNGRDCVSFQARGVLLLVELSWGSGDDLDMAVIQPDGELLSRWNKKSSQGGVFVADGNGEVVDGKPVVCEDGGRVSGREVVRYRKGSRVTAGVYQVQVRHFVNCGKGATEWNVRVSVNGKQIRFESGSSDVDGDELISAFSFTI